MQLLRLLLKSITFLIYAIFALIVLYFPVTELLFYIGKETRLFRLRPILAIEDALLIFLALALVYAANAGLRRKIEREETPEKDAHCAGND